MRSNFTFWTGILIAVLFCSACVPLTSQSDIPSTKEPQNPPVLILPTTTPNEPFPTKSFFQGPLSVIITEPNDNDVVTTSPIIIEGEANPGTVISFNDSLVVVDSSHKFAVQISLQSGFNTIEIVASDEEGNQDYRFLTLSLEESEIP
ncbi:MAG: hypothetical protein IH586_05050 [Anaerolineaceae bacterium]|nr:hypothetical protein [Anaerolineaceae bacterium]